MRTNHWLGIAAVVACAPALAAGAAPPTAAATTRIEPARLARIATVDPRYQSYNVEMAEVIGGKFWKPYTPQSIAAMQAKKEAAAAAGGVVGQDPTMFQQRAPIDLANPRLRQLAAALGPAYVRVSGTWANSAWFADTAEPPSVAPKGFDGVLTRAAWDQVIDFARAADAQLVTSFAISAGVRDDAGAWTPTQASKLVAYTRSIGGHVAAAEFFNEPDMPVYGGAPKGYSAADYARDFAVFRKFAQATVPDMQIVGPGSVGEGVLMPRMGGQGLATGLVSTADMLAAQPPPVFDVFSYHFYGAASIRCAAMGAGAQTTAADALSEAWLARTDTSYDFYVKGLRDRYEPGKPVWITETADAACGGNPWASTFLDSFRYLDQLGRLARRGVAVVFHNTLASSEYGLLDQGSFAPRPDYWAALLWHRLMGTTVLDAGPSRPGLHLYAQCLPGQPGGVTVLAINNSRTQAAAIDLPLPSRRYILDAAKLEDGHVRLNGKTLALGAGDALPALDGRPTAAGSAKLAPATISFFALGNAGNPACR